MRKLIILLVIIGLIIYSCEPEPQDPTTHFQIKNNSSYNVEVTIYNARMPDNSLDDLTVFLSSNYAMTYSYVCSSNEYPLMDKADSAIIVFNDERQIIYRKNDDQLKNILDISSWNEEISAVYYKYLYIYSITNEDYENAENIE
ncbi:MAG TPA: hypothetical protein P5132_06470 [Bacteroidales bacterium]|nr:hypothetical protein [Bacteroidales bacterium]